MAAHARVCDPKTKTLTKDAHQRLLRAHLRADAMHAKRADAARFYILAAYSYSGYVRSFAAKPRFRAPTALFAQELPPNIEVRLGDAFSVLGALAKRKALATTMAYLDPPYLLRRNWYRGATPGASLAFDHGALARLLRDAPFRWVMSYNDCPEVRALYPGHPTASVPIRYSVRTLAGEALADDAYAEILIASKPDGVKDDVPALARTRACALAGTAAAGQPRPRRLKAAPPACRRAGA